MPSPHTKTLNSTRIAQDATEGALVSAIIGVFDGEKYLEAAIESVLAQSYHPLELLIINDGSSDSSGAIADSCAHTHPNTVRVHHQVNRGISAARNRGVALAKGKWIAFLDADDIWLSEKISLQMEAAKRGAAFVSVLSQAFWSEDVPAHLRHQHAANQSLAHAASAFLGHRDTFLEVGLFNEESRHAQEWIEWSFLAADANVPVEVVPQVLNRRRLHLANKSRTQEGRLALIKAHLDRQRAAQSSPH